MDDIWNQTWEFEFESKHRDFSDECWMMAFQKIEAYPKWSLSLRKIMRNLQDGGAWWKTRPGR